MRAALTPSQIQEALPGLAGWKVEEGKLLKAYKLQDFKAGRLPATLMHQLSKGYSDEQIQAIAGYFAAQKK